MLSHRWNFKPVNQELPDQYQLRHLLDRPIVSLGGK